MFSPSFFNLIYIINYQIISCNKVFITLSGSYVCASQIHCCLIFNHGSGLLAISIRYLVNPSISLGSNNPPLIPSSTTSLLYFQLLANTGTPAENASLAIPANPSPS